MTALRGVVADVGRTLELRWAAEDETGRWARDPIGWLNSGHVWIASPFAEGTRLPETFAEWLSFKRVLQPTRMRLFPAQEQTVRAWIDCHHLAETGDLVFRNLADEKSRQIGETWMFAGAICWALHYHHVTGLCMHVDGGEIDDGGERNTTKSLFGKVRYIDRRLDRDALAGLGELVFRPFSRAPAKIENAKTGSVVYGEGQTDDPGRGGTFDFVFVDEAAFVMHGERVYAAIDEACPNGKALNSTVNGDGNFHARICDLKPAGYTVLRLHWSDHPIYGRGLHVAGDDPGCALCEGTRRGLGWDPREPAAHRYPGRLVSPWYDERVIGKTDEQVANELDIDRGRALAGRVYREFAPEIHVVAEGVRYDHELMARLELAWDFGLDVTSVVVCQDAPDSYRVLGLLEMGDLFGTTATPERVSAALIAYLADLGVPANFLVPSWTRRWYAVGDPAGQSRSLDSGLPFVHAYRRLGWQISRPGARYCRTVQPSVSSVKRLLLGSPKPLRICGVNAAEFAAHMVNNVWPTDRDGRRTTGTTPLDDVHNHAMRAFAYLAVAKWPPPMSGEERAPREPEPEFDPYGQHSQFLAVDDRYDGVLDVGLRGSV